MLNPGSFDGNTKNLMRDTTLRILRDVFSNTGFNPFIINLFNRATVSPKELMSTLWDKRDYNDFCYRAIFENKKFDAVLFAYGDSQNNRNYSGEIRREIEEKIKNLRDLFISRGITSVVEISNKSGTPRHPIGWLKKYEQNKQAIRRSLAEIAIEKQAKE